MKTFHCQYCGNPIFFENVRCLQCGSTLAFLPDRMAMAAMEPVPQKKNLWRRRLRARRAVSQLRYRMCQNSALHQACNFAVPAADPNPLCVSCRQTRILPDLSVPENRDRWVRIEAAKRRLFYTLARLGLASSAPPNGERDGPIYEFLADLPGQQVMTGHAQGVITINVAEADDTERTRRRLAMHEPYRTLLGHLRHESGHFYWDRLIRDAGQLEAFRAMFGDESLDYAQALQNHYARGGAPAGWQDRHVSAYATAHPWEDWAETWAHYLHMVDLMETAASYNTRLSVPGNGGEIEEVMNPLETGVPDFDALVDQWVPVTLLVNSLNRSLGQEDAYPFALSPGALEKLRFVHRVIQEHRQPRQSGASAAAPQSSSAQKEGPPAAAPESAASRPDAISWR
jgi:hypothetical protein